jgi:hypothetical protein
VTGSQIFNGSYCLALTDDGDFGRQHRGTASVDSQLTGNLINGTFQLIGNTLVATIVEPGGCGRRRASRSGLSLSQQRYRESRQGEDARPHAVAAQFLQLLTCKPFEWIA